MKSFFRDKISQKNTLLENDKKLTNEISSKVYHTFVLYVQVMQNSGQNTKKYFLDIFRFLIIFYL